MEWIVLLGCILAFLVGLWAYVAFQERKEVKRVHKDSQDSQIAFEKYQRDLAYNQYGRSIGRKY